MKWRESERKRERAWELRGWNPEPSGPQYGIRRTNREPALVLDILNENENMYMAGIIIIFINV